VGTAHYSGSAGAHVHRVFEIRELHDRVVVHAERVRDERRVGVPRSGDALAQALEIDAEVSTSAANTRRQARWSA